MLSFKEYNKTFPNGHRRSLKEDRTKVKSKTETNKNTNTDTIITIGEFIEFLQNVDYQRAWIKDDGSWYRFKFVEVVKEQTKSPHHLNAT
jgi:glucan-binding YG repeat protein